MMKNFLTWKNICSLFSRESALVTKPLPSESVFAELAELIMIPLENTGYKLGYQIFDESPALVATASKKSGLTTSAGFPNFGTWNGRMTIHFRKKDNPDNKRNITVLVRNSLQSHVISFTRKEDGDDIRIDYEYKGSLAEGLKKRQVRRSYVENTKTALTSFLGLGSPRSYHMTRPGLG